MRKIIYEILLTAVIIPVALCVSSPEIPDQQQKNLVQPNLGPILNTINTSQDDSATYKPFSPMYSNTVYGQPMISSTQIHMKQPTPLVSPTINVQSSFTPIQTSSQIKQTPPPQPPHPPIPLQNTFPHIGQTNQIKQLNTPFPSQISLQSNIPAIGQTGPTPVILQYLPQGHLPGTVHYLQLIPTRPLIMPISPYIAQIPNFQIHQKTSLPNSTGKAASINDQLPSGTKSTPQGSSPIGYPNGNNLPTHRFFRPNIGMELVNPPPDLSLNINEYLPTYADPSTTLNKVVPVRI